MHSIFPTENAEIYNRRQGQFSRYQELQFDGRLRPGFLTEEKFTVTAIGRADWH